MLKFAAIDAGANALRRVAGEADDSRQVSTVENIRLPVRLGRFDRTTIRRAEAASCGSSECRKITMSIVCRR